MITIITIFAKSSSSSSLLLFEFFTSTLADDFSLELSDCKSPQVTRTLLSIIADLNNAGVWMVSTRPLISISSNHCTIPLVTVSKAPITINFIVSLMSHSFFSSLARSTYFLFPFFSFTQWSAGTAKSTIQQVLFFLFSFLSFFFFFTLLQDLVVWPRFGDLFPSQYHRWVYTRLILKARFWVVHIPFVCMVKLQFLAHFPCRHQFFSIANLS